MNDQKPILQVFLLEYEKLKDEQLKRIAFRDQIIYLTLGIFGGILSFALSNKTNFSALLVIPWVCLILGWTYLVNDEKISALGKYIRLTLTEKIKVEIDDSDIEYIFGWETAHRSDKRRTRRKIQQLIIDEITFVFSGLVALFTFWYLDTNLPLVIHIFCAFKLILLVVLGIEIIIYADLAKGR
jgi:H+/Cl- antiporter ClcA